jgi:hypothetical protein
MYLIFDVLAVNGLPHGQEPLSKRLLVIRDQVITPYREKEAQLKIPFKLMGKAFWAKPQIGSIFEHVKEIQGERFFKDHNRYHKTDGIIFTPDEPYHPKTCQNLFKWKYMDKISIDLKVRVGQNQTLYFSCLGPSFTDIDFDVKMKTEDLNRLKWDMSRYTDKNESSPLIVEVAYDHWTGTWTYHTIRPDKNKANFIIALKIVITLFN